VKLADIRNPVRSGWLPDQGYRLLASPFLSGGFEARRFLEQLSVPTEPLRALTSGHEGGIYNGPQFRRNYVNDSQYGVPFLGSTDIMEADFTNLPLLRTKDARSAKLAYLEVEPGMTLISCSGTVGRTCYVRQDMAGFWSSQDTLKVVANKSRTYPGYLYAFLVSRFGIPMITSQASGSMIQHLEPQHIADLPVPRFSASVEEEIHGCVQAAADLRARFQAGVTAATRDLFESVGLPELLDLRWHDQSRDIGFSAQRLTTTTLRALNLSPRLQIIVDKLASVPNRKLGDICKNGYLDSGVRFAREDAAPDYGAKLIGQRQGFWVRPEGRWINPAKAPTDIFAEDESVMIASQGTLGENEVFCRPIFITGTWLRYVYTQHFLRVVSGDGSFPGAYLFAFIRSEAAFRVLRSLSVGSKQQDIHEVLRRQIPVPECTPADRERIAETVRQAYRWRDEADELEDRAQELLDVAVRAAAGTDLRQDGALTLKPEEAGSRADGSHHSRR
jgi:hypothetical protein